MADMSNGASWGGAVSFAVPPYSLDPLSLSTAVTCLVAVLRPGTIEELRPQAMQKPSLSDGIMQDGEGG